jgi:hypothetical protein
MANTTIELRQSGSTGNTPSLGILANGELAINRADGILYYKSVSNTLGSIRTTQPAGLTTEVQFNDAGSFGTDANFSYNKSTDILTVVGGVIAAGVNVAPSVTSAWNQANTANITAQAAFDKANQTAQLAFTTIAANGASVVADANNDTLTLTANTTNGIQILANTTSDTIDFGLKQSGVTAGTYGNTSTAVTITIDQFGRITSVSQTAITETDPQALAFAIALG